MQLKVVAGKAAAMYASRRLLLKAQRSIRNRTRYANLTCDAPAAARPSSAPPGVERKALASTTARRRYTEELLEEISTLTKMNRSPIVPREVAAVIARERVARSMAQSRSLSPNAGREDSQYVEASAVAEWDKQRSAAKYKVRCACGEATCCCACGETRYLTTCVCCNRPRCSPSSIDESDKKWWRSSRQTETVGSEVSHTMLTHHALPNSNRAVRSAVSCSLS